MAGAKFAIRSGQPIDSSVYPIDSLAVEVGLDAAEFHRVLADGTAAAEFERDILLSHETGAVASRH